jgi:hypothetical protein
MAENGDDGESSVMTASGTTHDDQAQTVDAAPS